MDSKKKGTQKPPAGGANSKTGKKKIKTKKDGDDKKSDAPKTKPVNAKKIKVKKEDYKLMSMEDIEELFENKT